MKREIKLEEHHIKFNKYCDEYIKKFGRNSLDRVITHDPLHFFSYTAEEIDDLLVPLEKAIKENISIPQINEEEWKKMIF